MKKRIIASLAIFALMALAAAAFAYTRTASVGADRAACCKSADSCPMKSKGHDHKAGHETSSCEKHEAGHAKAEGHSCDCCGDSCPMKKDGASAMSASDGKSCCDNCDCCKGKSAETAV